MASGSTQDSLRKVLGAIKDSTKVGLAQINSDYKDLDVAIVKATNHVESPPKEKHVRTIFAATSASRPRADVAYCIHKIAKRISKTHTWSVALKCLIVIHRTLREGDPTFREELVNYSQSARLAFNLSNFRDDSSPVAWDYSSWVRAYALYLEERVECFRILKYDLESDQFMRTKQLDTIDLLEYLPALQQLMYRLIGCQPEGACFSNYVIQIALNMILKESVRIYQAISDGMINLVDKYFEMQRHDAIKALDIYKRNMKQTERLTEFYEVCKGLDFNRNMKLPNLEQPPASFLSTMEEYVRDAPRQLSVGKEERVIKKTLTLPALEYKPKEAEEPLPAPPPEEKKVEEDVPPPVAAPPAQPPPPENVDFLGLNDSKVDPSALEDSNALALAIVPASSNTTSGDNDRGFDATSGVTGWELALVTTTSNNDNAINQSKLAGGFDRLLLDSLYDDALARHAITTTANGVDHTMGSNPFAIVPALPPAQHDPFSASLNVAPPSNVQMAALAQQQQAMMMQQQQTMMMQQQIYGVGQPANPHSYGMPYMMPVQNQYPGQFQSNPYGNSGLL